MSLETTDIFPVQKAGGGAGSVRKATISALLTLAQTTAGFWKRSGTELSPLNSGDDLADLGDIGADNLNLTADISAVNASFSGTLDADSVDGGEYAT